MASKRKTNYMHGKLRRAKESLKSIKRFVLKHFYTFMHIVVLVSLSVYIFSHWELCISMQFFSSFDGNNILFLCWIALIFLILYRVEGKGIKVDRRKQKDKDKMINKRLEYLIDNSSARIKNLDAVLVSHAQDRQTQMKEAETDGTGY